MFGINARHFSVVALLALGACDSSTLSPLPGSTSPSSSGIASSAVTAPTGGTVLLLATESAQLRASDRINRNRSVRWTSSDPTKVSVNSTGLTTAIRLGDATITASSGSVSERTLIRVLQATSVSVAASRTTFAIGESSVLSATARTSDGSTLVPQQVSWSITSGSSVTLTPSATAVDTSKGRSQGPSVVNASVVGGAFGVVSLTVSAVAVDPNVPLATAFAITPADAVVQVDNTVQFTPTASWSDGVSRAFTVAYTATGGTIDVNGLYRAGLVAGAFSVIASCNCGRVDTSVVTVLSSSSAAVLTSLQIAPKPVSLHTNGSQQFSVQSVWSDGAARSVLVTYSTNGGDVSQSGMYTAPAAPGTFRVIAKHTDGTLADSSVVTVTTPNPSGSPNFVQPTAPVTYNPSYPTLTGVSRLVNAGGDLQATLDAAQPGDEVVLASGATFTGNFILPVKGSGTGWIVVRAANIPTASGVRVNPSLMTGSAKVISPNSASAIETAPGAKRWRLVGFEVTQATGLSINYGLIVLGVGNETTRAAQPSNIVLDRMYIHGTTTDNLKRCVAFNGDSLAVVHSWLGECHGKGFDSQGVAGWNGAGPFLIENNRIEAAGQAVMFGGADPAIDDLSPSNIVIRRNYMFKPMSWGNGLWTIKATFELKHARKVLFEGNVLENHWADAQVGFAILLQTLADDNRAWNWTTVQDIVIQDNIIRNSTSGINMHARLAYGGGTLPTNPTSRVLVKNNLFKDVGRDPVSGATGKLVQLLGDLRDVSIVNNTLVTDFEVYNGVSLDGGGQERLVLVNNVFPTCTYGIIGNEVGVGKPALDRYAPGATVVENVFPGQIASIYPSGNYFPSSSALISFTSPVAEDYSLTPANAFYSGTLGLIGIDNTAMRNKTAGVAQ